MGKKAVAEIKGQETEQIPAEVVAPAYAPILQKYSPQHTELDIPVYTDETRAYEGINRPHEVIVGSAKEDVTEEVHTTECRARARYSSEAI